MALKVWKNKGWYFKYKDHNIFYLDEGSGEVVVLIHGFPASSWEWHKLWPLLKNRFRLVTLDMIGFGFSDKPCKHNYAIGSQADLLEAFLQDLAPNGVHIVASDYGDSVALELLVRHSEREKKQHKGLSIHSLCLLNPGLFPETYQPLPIQKLLGGQQGRFLASFMGKTRLNKYFETVFAKNTQLSKDEVDEFWELLTNGNGKRVLHSLAGYIEERVRYRDRWLGALRNTNIPVKLIAGGADPVSGKATAIRCKELIPEADTVLLEDVGHYPHIEAPQLVKEHYFGFMSPTPKERFDKQPVI